MTRPRIEHNPRPPRTPKAWRIGVPSDQKSRGWACSSRPSGTPTPVPPHADRGDHRTTSTHRGVPGS
ncbi:MAG: hypothetical protein J0L61_03750 [Planctomycetes bacterium]|nr:hypothetical protein [Planctomycetota bacterium]